MNRDNFSKFLLPWIYVVINRNVDYIAECVEGHMGGGGVGGLNTATPQKKKKINEHRIIA